MRADGPIRSRRAIDSRSFSFDAGAKRWNASRSYSMWSPARMDTPIARPPVRLSMWRIHVASTTWRTLVTLVPRAFAVSWTLHLARRLCGPIAAHG